MVHVRFPVLLNLTLLTLLLFIATILLIGCFYETNDDVLLSFLLRGVSTKPPISDLSLYFHGISSLVTKLYQLVPSWPWYGLTLYFFLFICALLSFRFIYLSLENKLKPGLIYLFILVFYLSTFYEHVFWINYSRLPILLAATLLLNAWTDLNRQKTAAWWLMSMYAILFFLAICIRPSMAFLGSVLVLPYLVISFKIQNLPLKQLASFLAFFLFAGLMFSVWYFLKTNNSELEYQQLDFLKSQILDFNWCGGFTRNPDLHLIYTGINHWFLADDNIIQFLKNNYQPDWHYFWHVAAPQKLVQLGKYLLFDQFVSLGLTVGCLLLLIKAKSKELIWPILAYHIFFGVLILILGLFFKVPPRVLTPAVSIFFLVHIPHLPRLIVNHRLPTLAVLLILMLLSLQVFKIIKRVNWQQIRQKQSEFVINQISKHNSEETILTAGLADELRALSPFKNYLSPNQSLVFLTGWQTLDPSYFKNLKHLTGKKNLNQAITVWSKSNKTVWLCNPDFIPFIKKYYKNFYHQNLNFILIRRINYPQATVNMAFYQLINSGPAIPPN